MGEAQTLNNKSKNVLAQFMSFVELIAEKINMFL